MLLALLWQLKVNEYEHMFLYWAQRCAAVYQTGVEKADLFRVVSGTPICKITGTQRTDSHSYDLSGYLLIVRFAYISECWVAKSICLW